MFAVFAVLAVLAVLAVHVCRTGEKQPPSALGRLGCTAVRARNRLRIFSRATFTATPTLVSRAVHRTDEQKFLLSRDTFAVRPELGAPMGTPCGRASLRYCGEAD